jgi:ectoine hydroxylase-related dioxygenase (phytanoyl-CoA dioxygenase family)
MKFENLWATTIFQDSLESHEKANIDLSKIILEKNKVTKNMTEEYKSENFLKNNHDSVRKAFFDPRAHVNMLSIEGDKQNRDEYRVLPQAGDLLLFPSFLQHMAHPNMSDEPRVSISFNVSVTLHKPS